MKVRDAAERLGLTPDSVRHWIRKGRLSAIKDSSGFYVIDPGSVESFPHRSDKSLPLDDRVDRLERRVKDLEELIMRGRAGLSSEPSHVTVVEEADSDDHTSEDPIDDSRKPPRPSERSVVSRTPLLYEIWPSRSVGPWPEGLSLRREDLYD